VALGGPAKVLELVQAELSMFAIAEDEIEVELPQNVDPPWGWEGKGVAVRLASGKHPTMNCKAAAGCIRCICSESAAGFSPSG
jgi:hypothetical protein